MFLVNGGFLHRTDRRIEILVNSSSETAKKIGYGSLKNLGEQSRAILALLFLFSHVKAQVQTSVNSIAVEMHMY